MVAVAQGRTAALGGPSKESGGIDPRLKPAAHQFEAIMIGELLKPLEQDPLFNNKSGGAGLVTGDAGSSTWSSLGTQSLARAIADAGGLGIADKVMQEVEAEAKTGSTAQMGAAQAAEGVGGTGSTRGSVAGHWQEGGEALHGGSTVRRLP